jgi:hypothetical protein
VQGGLQGLGRRPRSCGRMQKVCLPRVGPSGVRLIFQLMKKKRKTAVLVEREALGLPLEPHVPAPRFDSAVSIFHLGYSTFGQDRLLRIRTLPSMRM